MEFKKIKVSHLNLYSIKIKCKTTTQALKVFSLIYSNRGYLGDLNINRYEKSVTFERLPFKYPLNKMIDLIDKKGLRYENITLTEENKRKRNFELIKELKGGLKK